MVVLLVTNALIKHFPASAVWQTTHFILLLFFFNFIIFNVSWNYRKMSVYSTFSTFRWHFLGAHRL